MRGSSFPWEHGPLEGLRLGLYPGSSVEGWGVEGHLGIPQSETLGAKIGVGARRLAHVLDTELRAGSAQPLQPRRGPGASGRLAAARVVRF